MATYLDQALVRLKEFEGCFPWMYRDAAGSVVTGTHLTLPGVDAAQALPFIRQSRPATPQEIATDFKRVMQLPSSREPDFYRSDDSPELPQKVMDEKLRDSLVELEDGIRTKVKCYNVLPDGAKLALIDMAYQLTPDGLARDYPRMLRAIASGDWTQAAAESVREGVSLQRNSWTRSMLLSGAITGGPSSRGFFGRLFNR